MKSKQIFFIFIAILLLVLFFYFLSKNENQRRSILNSIRDKYEDRKDMPVFAGSFEEYNDEKLSLANSMKVVLFFNASWCPTCSQFVDEIKELKVPDNVLILSVDYDKNQNLRQKYKVAYQHTFVEVDQDGKEMYRWSGGGIDRLKKELGIE